MTEGSTGGTDTLLASVNYVVAANVYVENMSTTDAAGTGAISLTGSRTVQTITGNAGANFLVSGIGASDLVGLGGNDPYIVDSQNDDVFEGASEGTDNSTPELATSLTQASTSRRCAPITPPAPGPST